MTEHRSPFQQVASREPRNTIPTCTCLQPSLLISSPHVCFTSIETQPDISFCCPSLPCHTHFTSSHMAPDLNSLSRSPRSERPEPLRTNSHHTALSGRSSRRTSQIMGPPTAPASATAPHFGSTERVPMPHRVSSAHEQDGPLRHPRPLTAAELYAECEKEQEAVVCWRRVSKHGSLIY